MALFGCVTTVLSAVITSVGVYYLAKIREGQKVTATVLAETGAVTNGKLEDISLKVDEVHKIANGLSDKRVQEARESSFAKGVKSETDKDKDHK